MSASTDAVARLYATIKPGKPDGRAGETDCFGDPFEGPAWRADLMEIEELPRPGAD